MAKYTEAQAKAVKKYLEKNKLEQIQIRVPSNDKIFYKEEAEKMGLSLNAFIIEAINEKIERENNKTDWIFRQYVILWYHKINIYFYRTYALCVSPFFMQKIRKGGQKWVEEHTEMEKL